VLAIRKIGFHYNSSDEYEGKIMGKYMVLWEVDQSKIPIDPKVRGET